VDGTCTTIDNGGGGEAGAVKSGGRTMHRGPLMGGRKKVKRCAKKLWAGGRGIGKNGQGFFKRET